MDIFLVGGAVRDQLLGREVIERDWVVVGATPGDLLTLGYQQVGKDFPVFLHPESKEEYALARTERKKGHGYTGFEVNCDPSITLEEDLLRRDLTVNAIARGSDGALIDPYGGYEDLSARILRHVSEAFAEDPLRVLRTARFAARYHHLGFTVAAETIELMSRIVTQNELQHLPAERVWGEFNKALTEDNPQVFIEVLRQCGALEQLLPELNALFGVPQRPEYHPEVDTGIHSLMVLQQAVKLSTSTAVRFAALVHDLGKGTTPKAEWPRHIAHEVRGLSLIRNVCRRLKTPTLHRELALRVCEFHTHSHRALELRGKTLLKLLTQTGAMRDLEEFDFFLYSCEADARGRTGFEDRAYPQAAYLKQAQKLALSVTSRDFSDQDLKGKALGDAIRAQRIRRLERLRQDSA